MPPPLKLIRKQVLQNERRDIFRLAPKVHYAPLQQIRYFGGTGEPRKLARCVQQRAHSTC